jgi:hypothetical protein
MGEVAPKHPEERQDQARKAVEAERRSSVGSEPNDFGKRVRWRGEWLRSGVKDTVEQVGGIDIRLLAREGFFAPGPRTLVVKWSWTSGHESAVRVGIGKSRDWVIVGFELDGEPVCLQLHVERTAVHLGGTRPWWKCPEPCNRRAGIVYLDPWSKQFRCRTCCNPTYQSSQASRPPVFP